MPFIEPDKKRVNAVIFDWAGTTVDYGSFAPVDAFIQLFKSKNINVFPAQVRKFMGTLKIKQLGEICRLEKVEKQWGSIYGKKPNEKDIEKMYADFEPILLETLAKYSKPVPGAVELMHNLREQGIKIGSVTGYTENMMEIVEKKAKKNGVYTDNTVTADNLHYGRPAPYMCYKNAIELGVYPLQTIVKVGDAVSDIHEGINAGMWSVGVIKGGSELGLTEEEVNALPDSELNERCEKVREKLLNEGAHFVIDSISEVEDVIEKVNKLLAKNIYPHDKNK